MQKILMLHIVLSVSAVFCMFYNVAWAAGFAMLQLIITIGDLLKWNASKVRLMSFFISLIICTLVSEFQMNFWESFITQKKTLLLIVESKNPKIFIEENSKAIPWYARGALVLYRKNAKSDAIGYVVRFPIFRSQINFEKQTIMEM